MYYNERVSKCKINGLIQFYCFIKNNNNNDDNNDDDNNNNN